MDTHANIEKYLLSLESLLDISILLNSELEYSHVIQSAILTCLGQVTAKYGAVYIKRPLANKYELSYFKGVEEARMADENLRFIGEEDPFVKLLYEKKAPLFYQKAMYPAFDALEPILVFPLFAKERIIGLMILGEKYYGAYTEEDMKFLNKFSMIAANAVENSLLYSLATKDTKTGLYLHHYFLNRLNEEIHKCQRYENSVSVVMIDLDHFKRVNDEYGHQAGDYILEKMGKIILSCVRVSDLPSRFGGEEFSILLPNTSEAGAHHFADRLREAVEETEFISKGKRIPVTASMGVAEFENGIEGKELIEHADQALYLAKEEGRNRVKTYSDYLREKE